eukprot:s386_g5.t1
MDTRTRKESKEENFLPGKGYGRKQSREEHFPLVILKQGLHAELQKAEASEHPEYDRVNCALRGLFAIAAWPCAVKAGQVNSLGLAETLKADASLKRLEMAFTNLKGMDDATAMLLGKALPPSLEELILGFVNTGLGNEGAKNLALALSSCSNLRNVKLDFQSTALGDVGIVQLCKCLGSLPALRDLRLGLSETLLADEGITGIAEMLKSAAAFRRLVKHEKGSTTTATSFQDWELSANRRLEFDFGKTLFRDNGMALLSEALESLSPLLALNLNVYETGLGDSGLHRMAEALQSQQHLHYLNLVMANTRVSDEGIKQLMTAVSSWLTSLENLMLNLRGCTNILGPGIGSYADALRSLRSLRSMKLNLRNCSQLQMLAFMKGVLVTDWNPLTVYIWNQPYLRFAGQKYDETLSDRSEFVHLVNNSIIKHMDGFQEKNEDLNANGYMWFRQQYEEWLHARYCTCEKHRTPFLKPPPYTCETFGVRWEDVKFTAKEEESEDEGADPPEVPAERASEDEPTAEATEASAAAPSSADSTGSPRSPGSVSDGEEGIDVQVEEPSCEEPDASPTVGSSGDDFPGRKGQHVGDDDTSVDPCVNLWDGIRKQMENIIIWSLMSVVDGIQHRKGSVELFGYDFMIGEAAQGQAPDVWLIEVNSSPACDYSTPVTCPLVKQMMEDTVKIMVDLKQTPGAPTGEWQLMQHAFSKQVPQRMGFACNSQLEVLGKKMKMPKAKKKKKRKASKKSAEGTTAGEGDGDEADGEDGDGDDGCD